MMRAFGFSLALALAFLAGTFVPTASTHTIKNHYLQIDYMQIPPGQALKYRDLEQLWKPVHQLRVDKGYIASWRLYGHHFPGGGEAAYQYVTVTQFPTFQAMEEQHYPELFKEVHGADYDTEISKQTNEARTLTHTDIWALLDYVE